MGQPGSRSRGVAVARGRDRSQCAGAPLSVGCGHLVGPRREHRAGQDSSSDGGATRALTPTLGCRSRPCHGVAGDLASDRLADRSARRWRTPAVLLSWRWVRIWVWDAAEGVRHGVTAPPVPERDGSCSGWPGSRGGSLGFVRRARRPAGPSCGREEIQATLAVLGPGLRSRGISARPVAGAPPFRPTAGLRSSLVPSLSHLRATPESNRPRNRQPASDPMLPVVPDHGTQLRRETTSGLELRRGLSGHGGRLRCEAEGCGSGAVGFDETPCNALYRQGLRSTTSVCWEPTWVGHPRGAEGASLFLAIHGRSRRCFSE